MYSPSYIMFPQDGIAPWICLSVSGSSNLPFFNAMLSRRIKRGEGLAAADLTEDDMTLIHEVIKLLSPLKVAATLLSEENPPTISMIAPIQAKLQKRFSDDNSGLPVITEMKQRFRQDFSGCCLQLEDLLHSAPALDPCF